MIFAASPARRGGPDRRRGRAILAALSILAVGAATGSVIYARAASRPVVTGIVPAIGDPGAPLRIMGRGFGDERGDGRVEFDGAAPTVSSYLAWSDGLIEVRVPLYAESSLVRVVTDRGRSNPRMFMSRDLLPSLPEGAESAAVGPVIDSMSADGGSIGDLLVIRGLNFGANRDASSVRFSWTGSTAFPAPDEESGRGYAQPSDSDGEYVSWSDKEIRVRIPDGAVSGGVSVMTARGPSAVRYFQVTGMPGSRTYLGKRTYALSSFVTISRVRAGAAAGSIPDNSLYLWMPFPASTASQRGVKSLARSHEPLVPDFRGLSVYRLSALETDRLETVSQDWLVQVYGIETEIRADKVKAPPQPLPAVYATHTAADALVPSADKAVTDFARAAVGKERNHQKAAELLWKALLAKVRYDADAGRDSPIKALADGSGDSWDMALLYAALLRASGIPALPVSGIVVDDARRSWRHAWVEYYLYGFGWVPADPALGSGGAVGDFQPPFDDPTRYLGNLDDRHVAFSRGLAIVSPMTPDGRTVTAARRYSLQTVFEEAAGDLQAYTSFWSDVEVTGVY